MFLQNRAYFHCTTPHSPCNTFALKDSLHSIRVFGRSHERADWTKENRRGNARGAGAFRNGRATPTGASGSQPWLPRWPFRVEFRSRAGAPRGHVPHGRLPSPPPPGRTESESDAEGPSGPTPSRSLTLAPSPSGSTWRLFNWEPTWPRRAGVRGRPEGLRTRTPFAAGWGSFEAASLAL